MTSKPISGGQYAVTWKLGEKTIEGLLIVSPNEVHHGFYEDAGWHWFFGNSERDDMNFECLTADHFGPQDKGWETHDECLTDALSYGMVVTNINVHPNF